MANIKIVNTFHGVNVTTKIKSYPTSEKLRRLSRKHACSQKKCECLTSVFLLNADSIGVAEWDYFTSCWVWFT